MDRRALAQKNRKPQGSNVAQDKHLHAVDVKNQNSFVHKENAQNKSDSPGSPSMERNNNTGNALPTGECTVCRRHAICVCQRCGDFYCSPECQRKDWPSHRYICFPIPALVYPTTTLSTDAIYPVEKPLLTVNQIPNALLANRQNALNQMFNSNMATNNQQQPQFQQNRQYPNPSMNGQEPPQQQQQQQKQQQQQQQHSFGENISKASQQNANKVQKHKEPTATVPTAELPKSNSHVILTGVRTPNRCYVRSLIPADADAYVLNARKIDSYGKKAPPLGKMPKAHSYAIASHEGVMHRVEVLMIRNPDNIRVHLIDRGIVAFRRLSELREITDEIILLKQYTCLVPLRNVSNYVLNNKMAQRFATYEDLEFKIKYERVDDGVELLYWQTEKSLNEEIEQFCKDVGAEVWADTMRSKYENNNKKAKPVGKNKNSEEVSAKESETQNSIGKEASKVSEHDEQFYAVSGSAHNSTENSQAGVRQQQQQPSPIKQEETKKKEENENAVNKQEELERPTMIAPFETHYFKVGCSPFKAIVLDVSCLEIGYIGCIAQTDLACLQTVHKQLSSIEVSDKPYQPKLDEYCIAKFEDMWYRAQVTDIPDSSHYNVMYIDFTNEATLTSAEIRHYPASVNGVCKTNLCLIDGLPSNFSAELIKFLNEEIQLQTEITIDGVNKIDEQVVVIECKSLLDKISKKKLLT